MKDNTSDELINTNQIEAIIRDHNKAMREDMASEMVGGTRSKAITDVITVKAIIALVNEAERRGRLDELENLPRMEWFNQALATQREDSKKFGISNQPYVTKEWLRIRIAKLQSTQNRGSENE